MAGKKTSKDNENENDKETSEADAKKNGEDLDQ